MANRMLGSVAHASNISPDVKNDFLEERLTTEVQVLLGTSCTHINMTKRADKNVSIVLCDVSHVPPVRETQEQSGTSALRRTFITHVSKALKKQLCTLGKHVSHEF